MKCFLVAGLTATGGFAAETNGAPRDWKSSFYGGFAAKSGNTTERSYNYGGEYEKKNGTAYRYRLKGDGRYSKTEEQISASKAELSGEMRRLISKRWFVSGRLTALHDDIRDISYRTQVGPGIGRYLADSKTLTADVSTGLLYVREKTSGEISDYVAWRLSQRIDWQMTEIFKWWAETEFLMDVAEPAHYQIVFKAGVESRINSHLSLIVSVTDDYDSMPERNGQIEKNDFEISTGLRYTF
jgi:putative salt-induced outer membrane protein YdiY